MPKPKIKGGRVNSIDGLKKSLKKSEGGGFFARVPKEGSITVRFMDEPTEWVEFYQHFDSERQTSSPCYEGDPYCEEGDRAKKRYVANAVDTQENKVVALELPVSVVKALAKFYDKFNTILDRDYEITKEGTGLDTEYAALPEAPSKMNMKRYRSEAKDLLGMLSDMADATDTTTDDEDDDEPPKKSKKTKGDKPKKKSKPTIADEDDEDVRPTVRKPKKPLGKKRLGKK